MIYVTEAKLTYKTIGSVVGENLTDKEVIVILASCKHQFIRVHENLLNNTIGSVVTEILTNNKNILFSTIRTKIIN